MKHKTLVIKGALQRLFMSALERLLAQQILPVIKKRVRSGSAGAANDTVIADGSWQEYVHHVPVPVFYREIFFSHQK